MKQQEKPIVAMIYDFDGTLAPGNMQEYDFLKEIGIEDKDDFWREVVEMQKEQDAPEVITYMRMMIEKSNNPENPRPITKNAFKKYGATIPLFKGVREWFAQTRKLGEAMGIQIEHYINSSGLQEMVEGSPIGHEFKHIYASRFMYDKDGRAVWPAAAIDFTAKMQILYMINKGVEHICDNKEINNFMAMSERRIPFDHMIYFGDGLTDIPSMKLLQEQGGFTIAIYTPEHEKQTLDLVKRNIINFACEADYSKGESLYQTVEAILQHIKALDNFNTLESRNIEAAKTDMLAGEDTSKFSYYPRRRSHVILQGQKEILNLLGIIIHYFIVPLQHGYGFTEFLHITSERGLRNGSLSVVGILHRGSVARIRTAEVLCQLSFA